jgi:hypothetical protein
MFARSKKSKFHIFWLFLYPELLLENVWKALSKNKEIRSVHMKNQSQELKSKELRDRGDRDR